ncbi:hypothetical protein BKA70DRAFT_1100719 [Coprinopsis sp. MPI-PUGE-AT-0042]|nr:hypothetical protein BKA70DRAFT_1100719 [Coprinopsis sp. MPI-PUGE-AT-0042]
MANCFAGPGQQVRWNAAVEAQNVFISGGLFVSAGHDVNHHTHFHEAQKLETPKCNLLSELESTDNFRQIQQDTLSKATPETGEWIFEYKMFPIWRDPKSDVKTIWGFGIPGAGKTVLTSIVVNGVSKWAKEQASPICIGYFYIRYSDNLALTVRHCLEVLVKQTIEEPPNCLKLAEKVYVEHIRLKTRPTEEELLQLLRSFTTATAATFYFLDALDEAPVHVQFDLVKKLSLLNIKLFVTSRPMKALAAHFPNSHCFSIDAHERDIELHISLEIDRSHDLCCLLEEAGPSFLFCPIFYEDQFRSRFLHASLQMAALRECTSVHDVRETLANFPAQIEDVYLDTWRRINDQSPNKRLLARCCLLWVLNTARSIKVDELRYAVAISSQTYKFDPNRLVSRDVLIAPCRGLLVVDEETKLVRLVHYTAKATLERPTLEIFPRPHSILTSVCISRLTDHGFQCWEDGSWVSLSNSWEHEPFTRYAYDAWPDHAQRSLDDAPITTLVHPRPALRAAAGFLSTMNDWGSLDLLGPLHLASESAVKLLLTHVETEVNAVGGRNGQSALTTAACLGSAGIMIIDLLLAHPLINVNVLDEEGRTPLFWAARLDSTTVLKRLLAHEGIDANLPDEGGRTPLIWASLLDHKATGNTTFLKCLLAHPQIDINLADRHGRTPLFWAASKSETNAAKFLLAHPQVEVNLADRDGQTPLMVAAVYASNAWIHLRTSPFRSILAHPRVDVNATNKRGETVLMQALRMGYTCSARHLLACTGINIYVADEQGRTASSWAQEHGYREIVNLLTAEKSKFGPTRAPLPAPNPSPISRSPTFHNLQPLSPSNHRHTSHARTQIFPNAAFAQLPYSVHTSSTTSSAQKRLADSQSNVGDRSSRPRFR